MNLRLIGAPKLSDIGPEMVDAKSIGLHVNMPGESAYMQNCKLKPLDLYAVVNADQAKRLCADERLTGATLRANL
jgi:hypothetical protein